VDERVMPSNARSLVSPSVGVLRRHPVVSLSLGAAIVLSLLAVPTGLGALVTPWFVCELFAIQLTSLGETPQPRGRGWASAALVVLLVVVVIALAGWIAALGFGPDVTTADRSEAPLPWPEALRRVGLICGTGGLAVAASTPFVYAPLVLLDRGGRLGGAVLESAALVKHGGALRHYVLTFFASMLSLSPALVSMIAVARTLERAATPLGVLVALPFLPLSIPLGLGLLTSQYLAQRPLLGEARVAQRGQAHPLGLVLLLGFGTLAPITGLVLVAAGGLVPSIPRIGPAPEGVVVVDEAPRPRTAIPDTTLEVRIDDAHVSIFAGDGDGVGELPRVFHAPIEHVRVVRIHDDHVVEITSGGVSRVVRVDRAGLRVDDSVEARLVSRAPGFALIGFVVCFAICAIGNLAVLAPLGEARIGRRPRLQARRTAFRTAILLAPFAVLALLAGFVALFGQA
jgi:hypothetical protein